MSELTIAFITSRENPCWRWFIDSLAKSTPPGCDVDLLIVDGFQQTGKRISNVDYEKKPSFRIRHSEPKPTIWSGPHRITSEDWWSKSNSLNTAICLCETSFIAFVDDRCVLSPAWIYCVEDAIHGGYAVCGSYEKRANMTVTDGEIADEGQILGRDTRTQHETPYRTRDWYGGSGALPLEWCLAVNGFSEDLCDGLGSEDSMFGITLHNNGFPIMYDPRMLIIEDRTPSRISGGLRRADKGVSPNDKSHAIVRALQDKTTSQNSFDIRNMRQRVLAGEPFPPPSASHVDWFDGQPISEMK